jgi:hypothetical protein
MNCIFPIRLIFRPEGRTIIAQRFIAGPAFGSEGEDGLTHRPTQPSLREGKLLDLIPSDNSLGYFLSPLRAGD